MATCQECSRGNFILKVVSEILCSHEFLKFPDNNLSQKQLFMNSSKKNFKYFAQSPSFIDCLRNKYSYVPIRTLPKPPQNTASLREDIRQAGKPNLKSIGKLSNSKDINLASFIVYSMHHQSGPGVTKACRKPSFNVYIIL